MGRDKKFSWNPEGTPSVLPDAPPPIRGMKAEDLDVAFQPIIDLRNGNVFAHEAFVRCKIPEYLSPVKLFKQASAEMACGRLGRTVRDVIFSNEIETPVFVNIHPDELTTRWLVRPDDPLCSYGNGVYLEITEMNRFSYSTIDLKILEEICSRSGAYIVLDDLGAGFSNLKRLVEFSPAIVKIDRSLTKDLHKHPRKQIVVRHLCQMCTELGVEVVIEYIETLEELNAACEVGAHYGQGYFLARPGQLK